MKNRNKILIKFEENIRGTLKGILEIREKYLRDIQVIYQTFWGMHKKCEASLWKIYEKQMEIWENFNWTLTHQWPYKFNEPQWPYHGLSDRFFPQDILHLDVNDHTTVSQTVFFFNWSVRPWYGHWRLESKMCLKKKNEKNTGLWDRGMVTGGPGQKPDWKKMTRSVSDKVTGGLRKVEKKF